MLKIISLILLLGTSPVLAQIAAIQGHSFLGGTQAVTSGLKSSNYMQGIVPYATICVYNTGTTAPATIYANASGAPLSSCFTSNASISTDPGGWIFWAATNQGYDVVGSGGIPPNAYPDPIPLCIDCFPSAEFVSSGITVGTTPVSGGTSGYILYDNSGVLGDLPTTGTGSVVLASSPSTTVNGATCTLGSSCTLPASGVTSFNTRTGSVTLSATDVDAVGSITNSTSGTAANITATSNSTLTTLPSLSLPIRS